MQFGDQTVCHMSSRHATVTVQVSSSEKREDRKTIEKLLPETATNRLSPFGQVQLQANGFLGDRTQE
jgi:hypothetical protein